MSRIIKQIKFPVSQAPKLTRVAAYARVSTGKDAMLHSLSAQVSYYSNLIQNHKGWQYIGVYKDEALTGTKNTRDDFQRLLADCRAGKIDMVITKSISRFARNTVTLLETVRELKALGVDVFFEEQNIHSLSADGELMLTILASYAQEESFSASENQKWRIRKGFENGELLNLRRLFGYDISKSGIQVNATEAAIVQELFHRAAMGDSFGKLSRDLNNRGIRNSMGGKWSASRIAELLGNEKYCGNALLQKRYRNNHLEKKQLINNGALPKYYAEGTHPGIIDPEVFAKVQIILAINKEKASKSQNRTASVFSGVIQCANCGKHYKRITNNGKHSWNCATFQTEGKAACPAKQIPEEELYRVTAEVLGVAGTNVDAFFSRISAIRAENDHTLVFRLVDGAQTVKQWQSRSRRSSWTPEMKEAARQRELERRANHGC